ncbi:hypothetical protein IQ07DRAFT_509850 [Pyrenochaeta sp. DS3sAY3a]|nr:hypothetical protein IQ07DRAFT_509850 [Pyrenochaeta sp. DS3sAY3a]
MPASSSSIPAVFPHAPSQSKFENLPVEIISQILSYLIQPRSRLPGLTEAQSAYDFPKQDKSAIKSKEDLTKPPDTNRWAADLFSWHLLQHPFNTLSLTSKTCNQFVQSYCLHLAKTCNGSRFNLPFTQFEKYGPKGVYPDMSSIVYRRLWLQHAPRRCVYCYAVLDCYPFPTVKRIIAACGDCFYRQALTVDEVHRQYHILPSTILSSPSIRGTPGSPWVLRIDVEALALSLYGTRAFHSARLEQFGKPCAICAITRFAHTSAESKGARVRRGAGVKRKSKRVGYY